MANFWKSIGDWFMNFFKGIGDFFVHKEEGSLSNLEKIFICIGVIVLAWIILKILVLILERAMGVKKKGPQVDASLKSFAIQCIKVFYWVFIAFAVIGILGINITSFAGILSAVTVAVGLALQDIIGMFASGILLLYTKNFATGDFIGVSNGYGTVEGTVEKITMLHTILKTPNGQKIVISNNNVVKSNLTNYSANPYRRLNCTVGVDYNSDVELVKNILIEIMRQDERVNHDMDITAFVDNLADYYISFTFRCYIPYQQYWDVANSIKEKVLLAFRDKGVSIPFPTFKMSNDQGKNDKDAN